MASTMAFPREGLLAAVFQMFSFLKSKRNRVKVFDPSESKIDQTKFPTEDWSSTPCGPCKEDVAFNDPASRDTGFIMRDFVDHCRTGGSPGRHSRTGCVVFLNIDPIFIFSEKRGSCETSRFGYEFTSMKH